MQLTVVIAVFTDNYRAYISSLQIVAKRVHEQQGEQQYNPREIRFLYTMIMLVNLL